MSKQHTTLCRELSVALRLALDPNGADWRAHAERVLARYDEAFPNDRTFSASDRTFRVGDRVVVVLIDDDSFGDYDLGDTAVLVAPYHNTLSDGWTVRWEKPRFDDEREDNRQTLLWEREFRHVPVE